MTNPLDNEELYDAIVLNGRRSPGVVRLSGHDSKTGWDIKKGNAQSGASMTRTSEDPIEFTAIFALVKDDVAGIDDFADWDAFQAEIEDTVAGPEPKAKDVYHPDLARNRITSVVKGTIGGMIHDGKGGATVTVKFVQYKPPKKSGGQPSGSTTSSYRSASAAPDPNAAALAELDKLTKQYEATPWQ
jgi:hypothetical protein